MFAQQLRRAFVLSLAIANSALPGLAAGKIVISQIYGGGGNAGATYKNDFIELYNAGDTAVSVTGWSVQYGASGGTSWQVTNLSGTIQPGRYYLVQELAGAGGTTNLPAPDATGTIAMSATAGKVAVASTTTAFVGACPTSAVDFVGFGGANCSEGSATGATATPVLSNTTAAFRNGGGCVDSDNNKNDFATVTSAPNPRNSASASNACLSLTSVSLSEGNSGTTAFNFVAQLNVATAATVSFNASTADGSATVAGADYTALTSAPFSIPAGNLSVTVPVQVTGDTLVELDETFTVTLSSVVGASPVAPTLTATGTIVNDDIFAGTLSFSPATIPDGTEGVAYSQVLTVVNGDTCTFSSNGALPAGVTLSFTGTNNQATLSGIPSFATSSNFTISANCADGSTLQTYTTTMAFACETGVKTSTPIHSVQGSGATSPIAGQAVEVEGIVVGAFQGTTQLHGFYVQEPDSTWDGDPLTSEGVFIFDNGVGAAVNVGDRVRVQGTVAEFTSSGAFLGVTQNSSLTEIGTVTKKSVCSTGNSFTRTTVTLPTANAGDLERYEGMAIQFTQQLTVTGNFSLGTQGWIDLAPSLLYVPTRTATQANWPVVTSLNARSVIALDDASTQTNTNLYPTIFPTGGLSATNTLRAGSLVNYDSGSQTNTPLIGIMDDRFGEYRVQPTAAVTFYAANPRPDIAPLLAGVGGRFRAVSANVLNFFVTLGSRGAASSTEFDHQKTKVIEALWAMNADVYGLSEVQNFNDGNTGSGSNTYTNTALQSIVDGLNCKASGMSPLCTTPSTIAFAMVDTLPLGASNGTDAIRSAMIYKPSVLTPVGGPAEYYQNDTNRPTLAQTFKPATGAKPDSQTFTFVVNHFRSRSSACNGGLDSTFQGNCNGLRLNMAQNVVNWLAGNPTADPAGASRKILIVGDFNAYYGEDPIQYFANNGYPNLINAIVGISGYSYNFGSQAGYLDHGIANNAMNALVRSIAEWHNNADEPSSLQALGLSLKSAAAQVAYYGADPWAASDHDPFVIGFNTLPGDLNDDGVVNTADQTLLTGSVGKNASQVDRRMDYDGDGKITLNDYRIWATYYKAFIQ